MEVKAPIMTTSPKTATGSARTMVVNFTTGMQSKAEVRAGESGPVLYTVDYKMRKPHLRFTRTGDQSTFGSATFHLTSTKIDLEVNNVSMKLAGKSWFNFDAQFVSPTFNNQTLTWSSSSHFKNFDYILLDEQRMPLAKFSAHSWLSWKKVGMIEFTDAVASNDRAKDEIVVMGLTLSYFMTMWLTAAIAA